jgi:hypothetical protein
MSKAKELLKGKGDEFDPEDYKMFEFTFRISRITEVGYLKKYACEFWGLEDREKDLCLYDPNGDKVDPTQFDPPELRNVEKFEELPSKRTKVQRTRYRRKRSNILSWNTN